MEGINQTLVIISIVSGLLTVIAGLSAWLIVPYRVGQLEKNTSEAMDKHEEAFEDYKKYMSAKFSKHIDDQDAKVAKLEARVETGRAEINQLALTITEIRSDTRFMRQRIEEILNQRRESA